MIDLRPCHACGAPLTDDETHWSLFVGPGGGYACPAVSFSRTALLALVNEPLDSQPGVVRRLAAQALATADALAAAIEWGDDAGCGCPHCRERRDQWRTSLPPADPS